MKIYIIVRVITRVFSHAWPNIYKNNGLITIYA